MLAFEICAEGLRKQRVIPDWMLLENGGNSITGLKKKKKKAAAVSHVSQMMMFDIL